MNGTDKTTGKSLNGLAHLKQSIADILTTPLGTRVMRRDYGSALFDLVDKPLNSETRLDIVAATAHALSRWESRFLLERVDVDFSNSGQVNLSLFGQYQDDSAMISVAL